MFTDAEKQVLLTAKLTPDVIAFLESQDYDTLRVLKDKQAAWWQSTVFPLLTAGRIDTVIAAIQDYFTTQMLLTAPAQTAQFPALIHGSDPTGIGALAAALVPVESQMLDVVLAGLKANPSDSRYYQRALSLLSMDGSVSGPQRQVLVIEDGQSDLSGIVISESVDCVSFCQMRGLSGPAGRWPCKDGKERRTISLDDAMMLRIVLSCFPSKDNTGTKSSGQVFKALTDIGNQYRGPGNADYKPLYDTEWAAMIRATFLPEFDGLYGLGVGKELLPSGQSAANIVRDLKTGIKSGSIPQEYQDLTDAWDRAKKAHPQLISQAQSALFGSNEEARRETRARLAAMKTQGASGTLADTFRGLRNGYTDPRD